jgi:hypothetical protein
MAEYAAQHNAHATDSTMLMNKDKVALISFNPRALGRDAGPQGLMKILSSRNLKITGHFRVFDGLLAITMPEVNVDALCKCLDAINLQWIRDNSNATIEPDRPSTWAPFLTITHDNHTHFTAAHPRPFPAEQGINTTQREQHYSSPENANWVTLADLPFASYNVGNLYNLLKTEGFTQAELNGGQWFKSKEGLRSLAFPRTEAILEDKSINVGHYAVTLTPGLPPNATAYTPPTATTAKTVCNRFQAALAGKKPILTTAAKGVTQQGYQHMAPSPTRQSTVRPRDSPGNPGKKPTAGFKRSSNGSSSRQIEYPEDDERKEDGYTEVKQPSRTQVTSDPIAVSSGAFGALATADDDEDQDTTTMENPQPTTDADDTTPETSQTTYNNRLQQKQKQEKREKQLRKEQKKRDKKQAKQQEKEAARQQKAQREAAPAAAKPAEVNRASDEGEDGTEGRGTGQAPATAIATEATRGGKVGAQGSPASPGGTKATRMEQEDGAEPHAKEAPGEGRGDLDGDDTNSDTGEAEVNEGMITGPEKMIVAAGDSSGGSAALPSTPAPGGSPAPPETAQPEMEDDAGGTCTPRQRKRAPDDPAGVNWDDARRGKNKQTGWENTDNDTAMRSATTSETGLFSPPSAN